MINNNFFIYALCVGFVACSGVSSSLAENSTPMQLSLGYNTMRVSSKADTKESNIKYEPSYKGISAKFGVPMNETSGFSIEGVLQVDFAEDIINNTKTTSAVSGYGSIGLMSYSEPQTTMIQRDDAQFKQEVKGLLKNYDKAEEMGGLLQGEYSALTGALNSAERNRQDITRNTSDIASNNQALQNRFEEIKSNREAINQMSGELGKKLDTDAFNNTLIASFDDKKVKNVVSGFTGANTTLINTNAKDIKANKVDISSNKKDVQKLQKDAIKNTNDLKTKLDTAKFNDTLKASLKDKGIESALHKLIDTHNLPAYQAQLEPGLAQVTEYGAKINKATQDIEKQGSQIEQHTRDIAQYTVALAADVATTESNAQEIVRLTNRIEALENKSIFNNSYAGLFVNYFYQMEFDDTNFRFILEAGPGAVYIKHKDSGNLTSNIHLAAQAQMSAVYNLNTVVAPYIAAKYTRVFQRANSNAGVIKNTHSYNLVSLNAGLELSI